MHKQVVTISPDVLAQEVSGETVLLDLKSETYFGLDEVGTRIWQLLQENGEFQFVLETLLQEFEVDESRLHADLKELLNELETGGLIQIRSLEIDNT